MPANLLDHALSKARVHRSGAMALLVLDGNGQLACAWSELMAAMRWAVCKPARPRAETCLEMLLERVSSWIVSSQCTLAPKGAAAHQWHLLSELKSAGLAEGVSWRVQKPEMPKGPKHPATEITLRTKPDLPKESDQTHGPLFRPPPATKARSYTTPSLSPPPPASEDSPPTPWTAPGPRLERRLRGDCRGRVIEESRTGGLHIELSGE